MDYMLIECLGDVNVLREVIGDERLDHYFENVKVNVGSRWCEKAVMPGQKDMAIQQADRRILDTILC